MLELEISAYTSKVLNLAKDYKIDFVLSAAILNLGLCYT